MKNTFLISTTTEFLKVRRTSVIWLTLLAAAFMPVINFFICIERPDVMVAKFMPDPWAVFLRFSWKNTVTIILPMFVILVNSMVLQIEYRNNTWKQVYASPR